MSKEVLIAATVSRSRPLDGQGWRSSYNYATKLHSPAATNFIYKINPDNPKWESIHFSIARDQSGSDETLHENVYSGNRLPVQDEETIYIGDPQGADENFTVEVYQVR